MRTICALMTILLGVALAAGPASPQAKPTEKGKSAAEKAAKTERVERHQVTGELVSADTAKKMLVLKSKEKEMTFSVTEKAAPILAELKAGDKVTVRYTEEAGKLIARSVIKSKAKTEAAKPEKK